MDFPSSWIARKAGYVTVALGVFGIIAWLTGMPILTSLKEEYVPSSPPAALGHLLLGIALLINPRPWKADWRVGLLVALPVTLGLASLIEVLVGPAFGLSQLFDFKELTPSGHLAAQLSPLTGFTFILAGTGVLMANGEQKNLRQIAAFCALAILIQHFVVLLGYLYGTPVLYGGSIRPVAVLSALTSVVLAIGILMCAGRDLLPIQWVLGTSLSAQFLRVLLPVTFFAVLCGELVSDIIRREPVVNRAVQDAIQTLLSTFAITYIVVRITQGVAKRVEASELRRVHAEQQLLELNRDLEQRVENRTRQLQEVNKALEGEILTRTRVTEALRESEQRNRALLEAVPDWILRYDVSGTLIDSRSPKKEQGKRACSIFVQNLAGLVAAQIREVMQTTDVVTKEFQIKREGKILDFEARLARAGEHEVLAIVRDITEVKRMEEEVLNATLREQRRIGEELHDGLGQHLTGIAFMLKALQDCLKEKAPQQSKEAGEIAGEVVKTVGQVRAISRGLVVDEMAGNGLLTALQELRTYIRKTFNVECEINSNLSPGVLQDQARNLHLFRIIQEAISNAIKHGKATHVHVDLLSAGPKCTVRITDNGSGINLPVPGNGIGMKIMEYRSRRMGGSFSIQAAPEGGTVVACEFKTDAEDLEQINLSI